VPAHPAPWWRRGGLSERGWSAGDGADVDGAVPALLGGAGVSDTEDTGERVAGDEDDRFVGAAGGGGGARLRVRHDVVHDAVADGCHLAVGEVVNARCVACAVATVHGLVDHVDDERQGDEGLRG